MNSYSAHPRLPHHGSLPLNLECLESRVMMAGDVKVAFPNSGDIVVTGDHEANDITIEYDSQLGRLSFVGNNTNIVVDGQSGSQHTIFPPTGSTSRNLRIKMRGGDDSVVVRNLDVARDLQVDLGSGSDAFEFRYATVNGNVKINGGGGRFRDEMLIDDSIVLGNVVGITGGNAPDNFAVSGDNFFVTDSDLIGRLSVRGGMGGDWVRIANGSTVEGRLRIRTGHGEDVVEFEGGTGVFSSDVNINLGSQRDYLRVTDDYEFHGDFVVTFGAGNDVTRIDAADFMGDVRFDGGAGVDFAEFFNTVGIQTQEDLVHIETIRTVGFGP